MQPDAIAFVREIFTVLFFVMLLPGLYLFKNYEALFGVDPDMPGETSGSRSYHKFQVFAVWAHALALTGAFAVFLR